MTSIVYHDDNDGRCAAAIVLQHLRKCQPDGVDVQLFPATYERASEIAKGLDTTSEIYVVDFSFKPQEFVRLFAGKSLVWIDHHVTAIDAMTKAGFNKVPGLRDADRAACLLAWEFFNQSAVPESVQLIADRDVWRWKYGIKTARFHAGLAMCDTAPMAGIWPRLLDDDGPATDEVLAEGATIIDYKVQRYAELRRLQMFRTEIEGHSALALNIAVAGSEAFGAEDAITGGLPKDVDICCQYYHTGKHWVVSLYSLQLDVSQICKRLGGGGHKNAAGFTTKTLPAWLMKE